MNLLLQRRLSSKKVFEEVHLVLWPFPLLTKQMKILGSVFELVANMWLSVLTCLDSCFSARPLATLWAHRALSWRDALRFAVLSLLCLKASAFDGSSQAGQQTSLRCHHWEESFAITRHDYKTVNISYHLHRLHHSRVRMQKGVDLRLLNNMLIFLSHRLFPRTALMSSNALTGLRRHWNRWSVTKKTTTMATSMKSD